MHETIINSIINQSTSIRYSAKEKNKEKSLDESILNYSDRPLKKNHKCSDTSKANRDFSIRGDAITEARSHVALKTEKKG